MEKVLDTVGLTDIQNSRLTEVLGVDHFERHELGEMADGLGLEIELIENDYNALIMEWGDERAVAFKGLFNLLKTQKINFIPIINDEYFQAELIPQHYLRLDDILDTSEWVCFDPARETGSYVILPWEKSAARAILADQDLNTAQHPVYGLRDNLFIKLEDLGVSVDY